MNLRVFQSRDGDCLLLTGADGRNILIDGGRSDAFSTHVAPALGKLQEGGQNLDLVYVSHIDADHVEGLLTLLEDTVDWRVYDFRRDSGSRVKPPKSPRPPEILSVWHNGFSMMVDDATPLADLLSMSAQLMVTAPGFAALGIEYQELATSVKQAIALTTRLSASQLGIPLNKECKGALMYVGENRKTSVKLGGMKISIIGPFEQDLTELRRVWKKYLDDGENMAKLVKQKQKMDEDSPALLPTDPVEMSQALTAAAGALIDLNLIATDAEQVMGVRSSISEENLASLMLLVEEGTGAAQRSVLLTGDGHSSDIVRGLKHHKRLKDGGTLHVDVLKVQHHGALANIDAEFCRTITADHYVFCGNGAHHNPEVRVVEALLRSRRGGGAKGELSLSPRCADPFTLWFNSHSSGVKDIANRRHMEELEAMVNEWHGRHGDFAFEFLRKSYVDIPLG